MSPKNRRALKNKARHLYGLAEVAKLDIDILRKNASEYNIDKIRESVREVDITIQKLLITIGEIEYILNLDKNSR